MYAYPEEHAEIKKRVEALRKKQEDVVLEVTGSYFALNENLIFKGYVILNLTSHLACDGEQAKIVLQESVSKDRFLGYMTADIKVTTRSRELYR